MKRALLLLLVFAACEKPSDDSCRKALSNMRDLLGTESATGGRDLEGDVRRCRGGSSKKAVDCAAAATSLDELEKCEFMKMPGKEERCKKALANVRTLRGAGSGEPTTDELHGCARSSRKSIECAVRAETAEALGKCDLLGVAPPAGSGSGSGK